ncbi:MAG: iron-containing alcohol dehydrogenase [Stellaceae bacterium]
MPLTLVYPRIQFDFGAIALLPQELAILGIAHPLFITDRGVVQHGVFARVERAMGGRNDLAVFDETPENPTVAGVERAAAFYHVRQCDGLVAVGGGSVIDTAKAVSVVATHEGAIADFFGRPEKILPKTAPLIAVPTTAGTGSEASRGAGIHRDAQSRGHGINSPFIVPRVAICDPELTYALPPRLTAGTGMDALGHAVENFFARGSNPVGEALALDAAARAFAYVGRATSDGQDKEARWHMMMAALQAMMCQKGLGPVHALANTLGDQGLHHGTMVSIAMPAVLDGYERRYPEKAKTLGEALRVGSGTPAQAVAAMNERLGIPASIRKLGYKGGDLAEMAQDAHKSFFNITAPYHPSVEEYRALLQKVLG